MSGYAKVFNSILASSIWAESSDARIVWITMLAMANADGLVEASVSGLARMANVSKEVAEQAVRLLESPDGDSRSRDHDGRRIERTEGGWLILNHKKYRRLGSATERSQRCRALQNVAERCVPASASGSDLSSPDPDRAHSPQAKTVHSEMQRHPSLKRIATLEAAEHLVTYGATAGKPLALVVQAVRELAEKAGMAEATGHQWSIDYLHDRAASFVRYVKKPPRAKEGPGSLDLDEDLMNRPTPAAPPRRKQP